MKKTQLQIASACHENWNDMHPNEEGKFCLSCQKTVIDFTSMNDKQILSWFSDYSGNACGRFRDDQLNRDLNAEKQKNPSWVRYFLNVMIPAVLMTTKSYAQGGITKKESVVCTPADKPGVKIRLGGISTPIIDEAKKIAGQVKDTRGQPIAAAIVVVKGSKAGTVCDENGFFHLVIKNEPVTLLVSSVGFEQKEIFVDKRMYSTIINISLTEMVMGEIIISKTKKSSVFHQFVKIADTLAGRFKTFQTETVTVYPNPVVAGSMLRLEFTVQKAGNYLVEMIDLNGKVVQLEQLNTQSKLIKGQIRLKTEITPGGYILQLTDNKGKKIVTGKLVVK